MEEKHVTATQKVNETLFNRGDQFQVNMPMHLTVINYNIEKISQSISYISTYCPSSTVLQNSIQKTINTLIPYLKSIHLYESTENCGNPFSEMFLPVKNYKPIQFIQTQDSDENIVDRCKMDSKLYRGNAAHFQLILFNNGSLFLYTSSDSNHPSLAYIGNCTEHPVSDIWYSTNSNEHRRIPADNQYNHKDKYIEMQYMNQRLTAYEEQLFLDQSLFLQQCKYTEPLYESIMNYPAASSGVSS